MRKIPNNSLKPGFFWLIIRSRAVRYRFIGVRAAKNMIS